MSTKSVDQLEYPLFDVQHYNCQSIGLSDSKIMISIIDLVDLESRNYNESPSDNQLKGNDPKYLKEIQQRVDSQNQSNSNTDSENGEVINLKGEYTLELYPQKNRNVLLQRLNYLNQNCPDPENQNSSNNMMGSMMDQVPLNLDGFVGGQKFQKLLEGQAIGNLESLNDEFQ